MTVEFFFCAAAVLAYLLGVGKGYCDKGWPDRSAFPVAVKPYYPVSTEISIQSGLLMRGSRIIIPASMRLSILDKIHTGHQGISKCREWARQSVWWPGLAKQLEELIKSCPECYHVQKQRAQPLITSVFPELPWQKVATDLFEWKNKNYLLIVDYYSRYIEIALLKQTTAEEVIKHTKSIFARHGIPEVVVSDNGPQYSSKAYADFAKEYQFKHVTSSPYHPQSNGEAERAVGTIKSLLKKEKDPYLAILSYRSTPLQNGYCPSKLLMSRKLRTIVPISCEQRKPQVPDTETLKAREEKLKADQKRNFDRHRGVRELPQLNPGDLTWLPDFQTEAVVEEEIAPRSYNVSTAQGTVRRNRRDLIQSPNQENSDPVSEGPGEQTEQSEAPREEPVQRQSSRVSRPPDQLNPKWD